MFKKFSGKISYKNFQKHFQENSQKLRKILSLSEQPVENKFISSKMFKNFQTKV